MATRMRPSTRCCDEGLAGAAEPSEVTPPCATKQRQQDEEADGEDEGEEQRQRDRHAPIATPSPAAAIEPERISHWVPMTSVS